MDGFELRRQEKKKDIISAAFTLFRENGVAAVKITDIAEKANVSKVSIYNYFGSKEELVRQVMFDYMDKKAVEFKTFMTSDLSFKEKLNMIHMENMKSLRELTTGETDGFMSNELISSPQMQQFLKAYSETKIKPLFVEFIEQGKLEGDIDSELSTESIFIYIQAISGILSTPLTIKQRIDIGKLMYNGLKGK
jgi:AcrR family transcriptional regulator